MATPTRAGLPADQCPLLVDCPEAARRLGIGLTHFYALARHGRVHVIKLGRCSRVAVSELERLVAELLTEAEQASE